MSACPHCGQSVSDNARFCGSCGEAIYHRPPAPTAPQAPQAPQAAPAPRATQPPQPPQARDLPLLAPSYGSHPVDSLGGGHGPMRAVPAYAPAGASGALGPPPAVSYGARTDELNPRGRRQALYLKLVAGFWALMTLYLGLELAGVDVPLQGTSGTVAWIIWFYGVTFCVGGVGASSRDSVALAGGYAAQALAAFGFFVSLVDTVRPDTFASNRWIELFVHATVFGLALAYVSWVLSDADEGRTETTQLVLWLTAGAVLIFALTLSLLVHQLFGVGTELSQAYAQSAHPFEFLGRLGALVDPDSLLFKAKVLGFSFLGALLGTVFRLVFVRVSRLEAD